MDGDPHIPERLQADLRRVYRGTVQVPGEVDARVLAVATDLAKPSSVARNRTRMPLRWRVVKWVGVAAAVMAAFIVPTQLSRNSQAPVVAIQGDVNGDGAVDILDAFALARGMRDGDSSITKADIDQATARAVRLTGGGA